MNASPANDDDHPARSDASNWLSAVIERRQPLQPIPTGQTPELKRLDSIKAVIWDVYGTLVISGSGEVGTAGPVHESDDVMSGGTDRSMRVAMERVLPELANHHGRFPEADELPSLVGEVNAVAVAGGRACPEVDIVDLWRLLLARHGLRATTEQTVRLAATYEAFVNATWPMPQAAEVIGGIAARGLAQGIVSNAQVFTVLLVEDLCGHRLGVEGPLAADLCHFSNRYRQSKPSRPMFDALTKSLERRGIEPAEALYVGNDMLNDVHGAASSGFRTAWFAGDARSRRERENDPRCRNRRADVILTELTQLFDCLPENP